jgi:S1-C subfamily serine protease
MSCQDFWQRHRPSKQFIDSLSEHCPIPRAIVLLLVAWNAGTAAQAESSTATANGSGVIIGTNGEILTNNHVIEHCWDLYVGSVGADVVARDEKNDLAVIRPNVPRPFSTVVAFRDRPVRAGDSVVAMGYPLSKC